MTTTNDKFAIYNGQRVAIEEVYSCDVGQVAVISFDDENEEQVPLAALDIIA
jgi:hypothetical protein